MTLKRITLIGLSLILLCGCMPTVIQTEHEFILMRHEQDPLVILPDEDPLYGAFAEQVTSDPMAQELINLVEHTTEAFIATERRSSHPQTLANKPAIVLDSQQVGLLRDIKASYEGQRVPLELAMGLGEGGEVNLERAALRVPRVAGEVLLDLVEVPDAQDTASLSLGQQTTPLLALRGGYVAALDALYGQAHPQTAQELALRSDAEARLLVERYEGVPANAFAVQGGQRLSVDQAYVTPGVVGTFFYRLLNEGDPYYPQREMLWFANYEAGETIQGKVLLALHRMSGAKGASVSAFIAGYLELFPADRALIERLAQEVFVGP